MLNAGAYFNELDEKGLPASVIGPLLGAKLGIDWTLYENDFLSLKNETIPAFVQKVHELESDLCAQTLGGGGVNYTSLSIEKVAELKPTIQNLIDIFEI